MGEPAFRVVFAGDSKEHLAAIAEYIASDNPKRAVSFCDELIDHALTLEGNPYVGKPYLIEGHEDLKSITYGKRHKYLIIYKIFESKNTVEVWAFWHGAQLPPEF